MPAKPYPFARLDMRAIDMACYRRLIWRRHRKTPLGVRPSPSRLSDPEFAYSVLYAAQNLRCAFAEVVLRDRFVRSGHKRALDRSEITERAVVTIDSDEPLRLANLQDDAMLRAGIPTDALGARNHAAGRALSRALYDHRLDPDGVLFQSRLTNDRVIAVFDRAIYKLDATAVDPLNQHPELPGTLLRYGVTIEP